jgi:hypothetical protein
LSADYEAEQKELKEKAAVLQSQLSKTLEATANAEKFMKVVRKDAFSEFGNRFGNRMLLCMEISE